MPNYHKIQGTSIVSEQVLEQTDDWYGVVGYTISDAVFQLMNFLKSNKIPHDAVALQTLEMRVTYDHAYMAWKAEVRIGVDNYQVATPVSPNMNALLKEAYADKVEALLSQPTFKSETLFESLGIDPNKAIPEGQAAPQTTADKITAVKLEQAKKEAIEHMKSIAMKYGYGKVQLGVDPVVEHVPKVAAPLTYLELKEIALQKGRLAIPPIEDDKDVI